MGLLGSMTYVLRRYLRSVGDRLLTPRDLREYIVRLVLGTVFGVAIGFFTSANGNAAEQVIVNSASSLGAPALAFLAGYGVETYSVCWMAWRSSSPPLGSEAVFHKLARPESPHMPGDKPRCACLIDGAHQCPSKRRSSP